MQEIDDVLRILEPGEEPPADTPAPGDGEEPKQTATPAAPATPAEPAAQPTPARDPDLISREEFRRGMESLGTILQATRGGQEPQTPQHTPWTPELPEDPDALLLDGKALGAYLHKNLAGLRDYQMQQSGQAFYQVKAILDRLESRLDGLTASSSGSAREKAKAEIADMGFEDYDELEPKAKELIGNNPQALADPQALKDAYFLARIRAGKPMRAEAKSTPPASLPTKAPTRTSTVDAGQFREQAREVQRAFGLSEPLVFTEEELAQVAALGRVS